MKTGYLFAVMLTGWSLGSAMGASLTPYGLEVEARREAMGIDARQPRLGWKLRSPERGQKQTAYQVLVARRPELLAPGAADLWDSGRVASGETAWIAYAGAAPRSFERCWWKVRVWDAAGEASAWSEPAGWTMGALDRKAWRGSWIASPDSALTSGPLPIFRTELALDRPVRRALAFISGMGFHELRINGAKVGDHVLAPAWTDYRNTVLYETFDVTPLLKPGANALGVLLGNGFYNVVGGRYTKYTGSFGRPRVLVQLHLEFEDGSTREVGSDGAWRVHTGPITFSCIYGGEDYDARLEPRGWDQTGFDDSAWQRASTIDAPGGEMRAQSSPPVRVQQVFHPIAITQPKPGVFVYDLGQNFSGWPGIEVSGPAGAQVRLTPGELLDASGLVTQKSSGGPVYFSYTLRGAGREKWSPRFSYTGFRYVQVEGAAPESAASAGLPVVHGIEGQFLHLDAQRTGSFHCSKELFNRIHTLIDAAIRSNLQHSLTDCPHREKLGWLEQSYLMGPSLAYNWDLRTLWPKMVRDVRDSQTNSGLMPSIAPEYTRFGWTETSFRDSPEWGSAGIQVPWLAWQWYGDRQPIEDSYRSMKQYAEYLQSRSEEGLLTYGLGDWFDIGPGPSGRSKLTPQGVTATSIFFSDLRVLEGAAWLLGRPAEAERFAQEAGSVQTAFQRAFYKPEQTGYATGSQAALAVPLVLGLAPESGRATLADRLVADIRARGNHTTAGDIGYHYVIRALLDAGRNDTLFDMASRTDPPSYGAQLAAGATSLTEAWDSDPSVSQNHFMLGHIEEWFYAGLGGIRPRADSPGLAHIDIEPQPVGDLSGVEASWETFRGPVAVRWRIEAGSFFAVVDLPPGITANVRLPAASAEQVREGGRPGSQAPGVRLLRQAKAGTVFEVGSGHYEFEARSFQR